MKKVNVMKFEDDPLGCLRASIGGWPEEGYYLTFRGDQKKVVEMLRTVLLVLENAPPVEKENEPPRFKPSPN